LCFFLFPTSPYSTHPLTYSYSLVLVPLFSCPTLTHLLTLSPLFGPFSPAHTRTHATPSHYSYSNNTYSHSLSPFLPSLLRSFLPFLSFPFLSLRYSNSVHLPFLPFPPTSLPNSLIHTTHTPSLREWATCLPLHPQSPWLLASTATCPQSPFLPPSPVATI
jgi:hypothetical protein